MNYQLLPDNELTDLLKASKENAFREVYVRYWKELFFVAYRKTGNKELAEEIVQNIYLDLWRKRQSLAVVNLRAYLFASVRYAVINYIKSEIIQAKYRENKTQQEEQQDIPSDHLVLVHDLEDAINKGVSLLPRKTQEVFRLSRLENQTVKEIARQLKISEKAVEYHITRSLKTMRYYLKDFTTIVLICYLS